MASQQRQLRRLIEVRFELDEDDFILTRCDGQWAGIVGGYIQVPVIVYEPDSFFFSLTHFPPSHNGLEYIPGGHCVYFKPGDQSPDERQVLIEWSAVRRYFAAWLEYIVRELDLNDGSVEEEGEEGEDQPLEEEQSLGSVADSKHISRAGVTQRGTGSESNGVSAPSAFHRARE